MKFFSMRARPGVAAWILLAVLAFASPAFSATVERGVFLSRLWAARNLSAEGDGAEQLLKSGLVPESVGRLNAPVTRREALRWSVQALGLGVEARILSGAAPFLKSALPFKDVGTLSEFERGCLAVAKCMDPPLFAAQGGTFAPNHKIAPAEAGTILSAVAKAREGLTLDVSYSPKPGMTFEIHREGVASGLPKWRVLVDGFEEKQDVLQAKAYFSTNGFEMKESQPNYEWRLSSPLLEDYAQVRRLEALAKKRGKTVRILPSVTNANLATLPLYRALLILDPNRYEMFPIIAPQGLTTLAPLSSMAKAAGADAAINAGFFTVTGRNKGAPIGTLRIDRALVNRPYKGRTCLGWNEKRHAAFGDVAWSGTVRLDEGWMEVNAINRLMKGNALVLYTSHYGRPTASGLTVTEAVVKGGRCVAVKQGGGAVVTPGTWVLAGYGTNADLLSRCLSVGDPVKIESDLTGSDGGSWEEMRHIVQAGPFLLSDGKVRIDDEGFDTSLVRLRHPRSVVGLTEKGQWFFLVVDGRNGLHSVGASLEETAEFLRRKGATYALNLDGGGSTGMLIGGRLCNAPSDGWERPVSYGLGARPIGRK